MLRAFFTTGLMVFTATGALFAQSSPFVRKAGDQPVTTQVAAEQKFEFTGVIKLGDGPLVCVTEIARNRSHWLNVGQTSAGISVTSYDPEQNHITVRHQGQEINLQLKEPSFDPSQMAQFQATATVGPVQSAGLAETVPLTNEEKATDARMLVSDLLEIGMIQRKAYEQAKAEKVAAQREAAKGN